MRENKVRYVVGNESVSVRPRVPFDDLVCQFLDDFSKEILRDPALKSYPDVVSFAFWIRKANIQKEKEKHVSGYPRLGRGLAFHIAPSNVPINSMFSFVFGLLSGNSNIVRISSKEFPQVRLLCEKMNELLEQEAYVSIKDENALIQYERDQEITNHYSAMADVRIVWGGDDTIQEIRKSPMKPRGKEIVFAYRYSFGLISPEYVLGLSAGEMKNLATGFYNDTYLMDQNACSAPHMIVWVSEDQEKIRQAQNRFWRQVYEEAQRYTLEDIKSSEKYTSLCLYAAQHGKSTEDASVLQYDNLLYVVDETRAPKALCERRGKFGMFYQCRISDLDEICSAIDQKVQTVAVAGIEEVEVRNWIVKNHLPGIDRVVPFGKTLDIGLIWDGYDLITEMSRLIG